MKATIQRLGILALTLFIVSCTNEAENQAGSGGLFSLFAGQESKNGTMQIVVNGKSPIASIEFSFLVEGIDLGTCTTTSQTSLSWVYNCYLAAAGGYSAVANITYRDGSTESLQMNGSITDFFEMREQNPRLKLTVGTPNGSAVVSSNPKESSGSILLKRGQTASFKIQSSSPSGNDIVKWEWDRTGTGNNFVTVSANWTHRILDSSDVGEQLTLARVTDEAGLSTTVKFYMVVQCKDAASQLAIKPTAVMVTPGSKHNYFNYNAAGAVSGGDGKYVYQWDYNGDGVWDPYDPVTGGRPERWTSLSNVLQYTIYGSDPKASGPGREIGLRAMDGCGRVASTRFSRVFKIPSNETVRNSKPDGVPAKRQKDFIPGYYFLHGNVSPVGDNDAKHAKADYIATYQPGDFNQRVVCSYNRAEGASYGTFEIQGLNAYDSPAQKGRQHGLSLRITDIYEPQDGAGGGTAAVKEPKIAYMSYAADGAPDGVDSKSYGTDLRNSLPDNCETHVFIKRVEALGVCADGTPKENDVILVDGTFSCPSLEAPDRKRIKVEKGAFYCEFSFPDGCYGGGGGGGGQPPTPG